MRLSGVAELILCCVEFCLERFPEGDVPLVDFVLRFAGGGRFGLFLPFGRGSDGGECASSIGLAASLSSRI